MKLIVIILGIIILGVGAFILLGGEKEGTPVSGTNPPNSAEGAPEGSIHNLPVPTAVAAVRSQVAQKAGVSETQVLIETAFEREWSDGCLGLGGPAESCLQAITPGWEVTVMVKGKQEVYRTNEDGTSIRQER